MKKIIIKILDLFLGTIAATIFYAIIIVYSLIVAVVNVPKLFKRKKKVRQPDKKVFFNDPFEFAHFQKRRK